MKNDILVTHGEYCFLFFFITSYNFLRHYLAIDSTITRGSLMSRSEILHSSRNVNEDVIVSLLSAFYIPIDR